MLSTLIDTARQRSILHAGLSYIDGNDRARMLYEKLGFSECARFWRAYRFGDGSFHDEVIMIKSL